MIYAIDSQLFGVFFMTRMVVMFDKSYANEPEQILDIYFIRDTPVNLWSTFLIKGS